MSQNPEQLQEKMFQLTLFLLENFQILYWNLSIFQFSPETSG